MMMVMKFGHLLTPFKGMRGRGPTISQNLFLFNQTVKRKQQQQIPQFQFRSYKTMERGERRGGWLMKNNRAWQFMASRSLVGRFSSSFSSSPLFAFSTVSAGLLAFSSPFLRFFLFFIFHFISLFFCFCLFFPRSSCVELICFFPRLKDEHNSSKVSFPWNSFSSSDQTFESRVKEMKRFEKETLKKNNFQISIQNEKFFFFLKAKTKTGGGVLFHQEEIETFK